MHESSCRFASVLCLAVAAVVVTACETDPAPPHSPNDPPPRADSGSDVTTDPDVAPDTDAPPADSGSTDVDAGECPAGERACGGDCVDPQTNPNHCGECDSPCPPPPHAETTGCSDGTCQFQCVGDWTDRNDDLSNPDGDGCEFLDCDQTNSGREACDQDDNDCDGYVDESCPGTTTLVGGPNTDRINAVTAHGSTLVVGGTTAGPLEGNSVSGNFDGFVGRLGPSGAIQWLKVFGAGGSERIDDVTVASDGSIYAIGSGDSEFGGGRFNGQSDALLTKFDADGNRQWVAFHGTPQVEFGRSVTVNADGDVVITAQTRSATSQGSPEGIVAKYSSRGQRKWSKRVGTDATDAVATADGEIHVTGYTSEPLNDQNVAGLHDFFAATYSSNNGIRKGAVLLGGPEDDRAYGITVGDSGGIFLTGATESAFGGTESDEQDGFVARFDPLQGGLSWIAQFGNAGDDIGRDLVVDRGDLVVVATIAESLGGESSAGDTDVGILNYSLSGNRGASRLLGTPGAEEVRGLTATDSGTRAMGGRTEGDLEGAQNGGAVDGFVIELQ